MRNKLMKGFIDLIYGTDRVRRKFEIDNPTEKVLAANSSKVIETIPSEVKRHEYDWIISKRAIVMLTNKNIICNQWTIPLDIISKTQLIEINSIFGDEQVLIIETTKNKNYQFEMQFNNEWTDQKRLPITLQKGEAKHSDYSIVVRIIATAFLIYWLLERFIIH